MKKKLAAMLLFVTMAMFLAACGNGTSDKGITTETGTAATVESEKSEETKESKAEEIGSSNSSSGYEIALVTDYGTIDDKSFNQGAWEGVVQYGDEFGVTYKYYQPTEKTTDAYVETIDLAIQGGAKIVVCPGYLFSEAVYTCQEEYPDTYFIILDAQPKNADGDVFIADNTMAITYQEDEAGFLAGYAAVKEGYKSLGFMGGMAVPAVKRFGFGYVQGIEYAAKELGLESVDLVYYYTGAFAATPEAQAQAASWYESGVEVIFGCGGAVGNSVMAAAETAGKFVIGVDVDQSSESDTVITSAVKGLSISVYDGVKAMYDGSFPGGKISVFHSANHGVAIVMDNAKFENFTQADYEEIYAKVASGEITLFHDTDKKVTDISLEKVKVSVVE